MKPWHKQGEKIVYNGYRRVVQRSFVSPEGREYRFDVKDEGDVVCVLALTPSKEVIMIRQFRPGPERYLLELPGGGIDSDETHFVAMEREFLEETGYIGHFAYIGTSLSCPYSTRVKYNFLATNCYCAQELDPDAEEKTEVVLLPLEDFKSRLYAGEFPESDTGFLALTHYETRNAFM